jgi:hypothetical protein
MGARIFSFQDAPYRQARGEQGFIEKPPETAAACDVF